MWWSPVGGEDVSGGRRDDDDKGQVGDGQVQQQNVGHSAHASLGDDHVDDETVSDDAEDRDDAVQDRHGDLVQTQTDPRDDVVL